MNYILSYTSNEETVSGVIPFSFINFKSFHLQLATNSNIPLLISLLDFAHSNKSIISLCFSFECPIVLE